MGSPAWLYQRGVCMVEKTVRMNLLFDFYGPLLTERQQRFFEMYYAQDLSLGEIAEASGVSRQAVYDIIKRSAAALEGFDERLGLVARHERMATQLKRLEKLAEELSEGARLRAGLSEGDKRWLQAKAEELRRLVRAIDEAEE